MNTDRIHGVVFGLAYGDAMGWPVEFTAPAALIRSLYPPDGPRDLPTPAEVTDDTQMTLALGQALMDTPRPYTPEALSDALIREWVAWNQRNDDPTYRRAPGITCVMSLNRIEGGLGWAEATSFWSKGNGTNMRVAPVALLPEDDRTRAGIAQRQAAITHANPTALAAADLTAWVIRAIADETPLADLLPAAHDYARNQRTVYHDAWLGELWQRSDAADASSYIARGWDECLAALARVSDGLAAGADMDDPCEFTGNGAVAEEALATALLCFLLSPEEPVEVLRRACVTRGDSDSIACIAGALVGAYSGMKRWPATWSQRIEHRAELGQLARFLAGLY